MKIFYDTWYRFGTPPWVGQPRPELVNLVESGAPCSPDRRSTWAAAPATTRSF